MFWLVSWLVLPQKKLNKLEKNGLFMVLFFNNSVKIYRYVKFLMLSKLIYIWLQLEKT